MTLWCQLQSLPGPEQTQIGELFGKYSLELEVQSHLANWLEIQPWGEAVDSNVQEQAQMAKELLDNLVDALRQKALEASSINRGIEAMILINKLTETANNIEIKYRNNPTVLASVMHQLLITETQMISQHQLVDGMEGTEDAARHQDYVAGQLAQQSQEMEQVVKTLEQQKENYVIKFEEIRNKIVLLESKYKEIESGPSMSQQLKDESLKRCKGDMEKMWSSVKEMAEALLGRRNEAIEKLKFQLEQFQGFQKDVLESIVHWKYNQKLHHCGFTEPGPLDDLKKHCESLAELEWRGYTHTMQVENLFLQVLQNNKAELSRMTEIKNAYKTLLTELIQGAFVIEKQPPQVLKTQTKFTSTVRHLIGGKLNMQMSKPEVTATIITEKQAEELYRTGTWKSQGQDEILNNKKVMEYIQDKDSVVAEFKNMSLKKVNRQGKKNTEILPELAWLQKLEVIPKKFSAYGDAGEKPGYERVMDEKSTLMFQAQLYIGGEKFSVMQLSLPVSVIVHGNQQPEAEGTIFWDNAFSQIERTPFEVCDTVTWQEFTVALNARWALSNMVHLNENHLNYLASKLYGERPLEGYDARNLKKESFNKDNLPERPFTFWNWFYHIMDLVKKNIHQEWTEGLVMGFIGKDEAREMLLQKPIGTFLLRFSDGILGGISVAYVIMEHGNVDVWNIEPWSYRDLGKRNLSDRMKDLEELKYLYPDVPKDDAFGRFYSKKEPQQYQPGQPGEYVSSNLTCQVPRTSHRQQEDTNSFMEASSPLPDEAITSTNWAQDEEEDTIDFSSIIIPDCQSIEATLSLNDIEHVFDHFCSIQLIEAAKSGCD